MRHVSCKDSRHIFGNQEDGKSSETRLLDTLCIFLVLFLDQFDELLKALL
jgi:hypothetical protein